MYKYVFLDLDGTLTDSKDGILNCAEYALRKMGVEEIDRADLMKFIGPPLVVSFSQFYGFNEADARKAVEYYRERFSDIGIFENRAYEGVHEFLQKLTDHARLPVLATSKPKVYADRIAVKYGLRPYMKLIAGAELDGTRDSKAEVIEYAIEKLGIEDRSKVIMVGDRHQDIEGAKKCGVACCGVSYGYAAEGELEKAGADYIAANFDELYDIIMKRND